MVTFGTSLRPGNIQATMMISTTGLGTPKMMVPVQVRMATISDLARPKKLTSELARPKKIISDLARPKKIIIVTAVSTLGGNLQITNIIH